MDGSSYLFLMALIFFLKDLFLYRCDCFDRVVLVILKIYENRYKQLKSTYAFQGLLVMQQHAPSTIPWDHTQESLVVNDVKMRGIDLNTPKMSRHGY